MKYKIGKDISKVEWQKTNPYAYDPFRIMYWDDCLEMSIPLKDKFIVLRLTEIESDFLYDHLKQFKKKRNRK